MFFLKKLAGIVYFVIMAVSGAVFFCVVLDVVSSSTMAEAVDAVRADMSFRVLVGLAGLIIVSAGVSGLVRSRKNRGRTRLITFQNPDGEVTVSISAIENYVQRVARDIDGITDVRASAKVGKKGISIISFVSIAAGTNIPEVTERIQMAVKSKVQDMLGVEERIIVTMHITKILKDAETPHHEGDETEKSVSPPFREIE